MKAKFFSWATLAHIYNRIPFGVCKCETSDDAKGYTSVLSVLLAAYLFGLLEGGAL